MKKYLILAAILVLGFLGYKFYPSDAKASMILTTETVKRTNLVTEVTATGTVEPITLVEIGTQVSGVISKIYVDYNSTVKAGEILAELDKRMLNSELETSRSTLKSRQVDSIQQWRNYTRYKELWEKQAVSKVDWENAQDSYETAKLAVASSRAAVFKSETNLGYATIFSTIDGVVVSRAVEEGQTVAASFSTPTLFTIANDLTKMRVIANVDEADIGEVKEGQRVSFGVDAFPDDEFQGTVQQVRLEATTTSNVVTYEVVIDAPNPDLKLKPGLTANVTIYTLEEEGVLVIPPKALRFTPDPEEVSLVQGVVIDESNKPEATEKTVWIKDGNRIYPKGVKVGASNETDVEVLGGLSEGQEVILGIAKSTSIQGEQAGGESSPFMPKRPSSNSTKKK